MTIKFANRAKMTTSTTGTGSVTLSSASLGYQTFASAGVVDGDEVRYVIEDGVNWEIGTGVYTSNVMTRSVIESSTGSLLNLSGNATVLLSIAADDFNPETITIASATQTQIAYFPVVSFRSIKLIIQAYDYVTGDVHVSELLVVHNGTTASATEYGVVYTGSNPIVVYDVDISAGNVRLLATASANPITYAIVKTMLTTAAISTESFSWDSNTESPGPA